MDTKTHVYMHTHTVYTYHAPSNIHITWRYMPAGCVLVPTKDEYLICTDVVIILYLVHQGGNGVRLGHCHKVITES